MTKVRHLLGISGGKDSSALAIYLNDLYPQLTIEYYSCDTGKELEETYTLVDNLQAYLGKKIDLLQAAENSHLDPFDHFLQVYGGFLPSSVTRWCTKKLKLDPFEKFVGDDLVISYVGIRDDENREGYISKKSNIQTIFPYRKNIWSEDVIQKVLQNSTKDIIAKFYEEEGILDSIKLERVLKIVTTNVSPEFDRDRKLDSLLKVSIKAFNHVVFRFIKEFTNYPLSYLDKEDFPLLNNEDGLVREDVFRILRESGVGVPAYYEKREFEVDGKKGYYSRSRSGCYFCFFQQKIEWVWLYEQHPQLFAKAIEYEKEGYTWMQDERLEELAAEERRTQIKRDAIARASRQKKDSPYLLDLLDDAEGEGCAACFI